MHTGYMHISHMEKKRELFEVTLSHTISTALPPLLHPLPRGQRIGCWGGIEDWMWGGEKYLYLSAHDI